MECNYNVRFIPHKRSSLLVKQIPATIVYASSIDSAKELAKSIVRDYYDGDEYMTKQYKYLIDRE